MIFCVEDDNGIRNLMLYTLNASGFDARGFQDAAEFWTALKDEKPQLILLDIMLPGEDGIMILKKLKADDSTADIPVIMASAKSTEYDKVLGLDLGADDYLGKPFGMMEMVSRVKSVLRRVTPKDTSITRIGIIAINPAGHSVSVNGTEVILTLKEYDLLNFFMNHHGIVFSREQLLEKVWGHDFLGETRTVDVHVGTLRTKLGAAGDYITTIRGVGYKMEEKT
ncbi:MAG: response regulator transcription factor [Oscillospiraceae bacterium]|nr:response regulator transcription factor [Oscillospiraceae bacterium]